MLNKILLIGSLTKHEAHGVSLGFESLIDGFKLTNANVKIIDISDSESDGLDLDFSDSWNS